MVIRAIVMFLHHPARHSLATQGAGILRDSVAPCCAWSCYHVICNWLHASQIFLESISCNCRKCKHRATNQEAGRSNCYPLGGLIGAMKARCFIARGLCAAGQLLCSFSSHIRPKTVAPLSAGFKTTRCQAPIPPRVLPMGRQVRPNGVRRTITLATSCRTHS